MPVRSIGRSQAAIKRSFPSRSVTTTRTPDPAADLNGLTAEQWEAIDEEMRIKRLQSLDALYKGYVARFYEASNLCVRLHDACVRNHKTWRYVAMIGTGLLACLNFAAAKRSFAAAGSNTLPILASLGAVLLAVLANLETFANSAERAQTYRESRELYLDAAEQYDRAWSVAVVPMGITAQAYENAVELYGRIVAADQVLRRSFKELTKQSK